MLISLIGPDDYRREKRKKILIEEFRKKYGFLSAERIDASFKEGRQKFHEIVVSPSLFSLKRLVILESIFESEEKEYIDDLKRSLCDQALWVFVSCPDKIPAAIKFIKKSPAIVEEFPFLEGDKWREFIQAESAKRKIRLKLDSIRFLAQAYKEDTWRLITELDRVSYKNSPLSPDDFNSSEISSGIDAWQIIGRLRSDDLSSRLRALHEIFENQESPAKIFNFIAAQQGLESRCAEYDVAVKSGKLEYEEALLDFILG